LRPDIQPPFVKGASRRGRRFGTDFEYLSKGFVPRKRGLWVVLKFCSSCVYLIKNLIYLKYDWGRGFPLGHRKSENVPPPTFFAA